MTEILTETSVQASKSIMRGRLILLAILAIFVLPFFILPLIISPEQMEKTNKGLLIKPHMAFGDLHLMDVNNNLLDVSTLNGKWTLLYFSPPDCDQACVSTRTNALYAMHQIPLMLGRDLNRVQQLLVFTVVENEFNALVHERFSGMLQAHGDVDVIAKQFDLVFPGIKMIDAGYIYLMSPDGYIFICYPSYENEQESIVHAQDIRDDLKKSIKGSRI